MFFLNFEHSSRLILLNVSKKSFPKYKKCNAVRSGTRNGSRKWSQRRITVNNATVCTTPTLSTIVYCLPAPSVTYVYHFYCLHYLWLPKSDFWVYIRLCWRIDVDWCWPMLNWLSTLHVLDGLRYQCTPKLTILPNFSYWYSEVHLIEFFQL